mgnify:CR=1 FL=1
MEKMILSNLSLEDLATELAEKVLEIHKKTYQKELSPVKEEYLNVKQAADLLDLAVATLYTMTCRRKIPFIKKGKKLYFLRTELELWLSSGKKAVNEGQQPSTSEMFIRNRRK